MSALNKRTTKNSSTSPKRVGVAERSKQALELRKAGATYKQIGDSLGVPHTQAYNYVRKAMDEMIREPAEELRTMQYERLNTMLLTIWPEVREGSLPAVDRALRIMERQAHLLGLDAPTEIKKTETRVTVSTTTDEYIQALRKARQAEQGSIDQSQGEDRGDDEIVIEADEVEEVA